MARLKNGAVEPMAVVGVVMMSFTDLWKEGPVGALIEVIDKARNPSYKVGDPAKKILVAKQLLLPNGEMRKDIRNIIVSAVSGNGGEMSLDNPLQ